MTRRPHRPGSEREPIGRAIRTLLQGEDPATPTSGSWSHPMRTTMSFLTTTSSIASELPADPPAHRLEVLGYDRGADRIVLREHIGGDTAMALLATAGAGAGGAIPLPRGARVATRNLVPLERVDARGWELTTRVMQRRGLR